MELVSASWVSQILPSKIAVSVQYFQAFLFCKALNFDLRNTFIIFSPKSDHNSINLTFFPATAELQELDKNKVMFYKSDLLILQSLLSVLLWSTYLLDIQEIG